MNFKELEMENKIYYYSWNEDVIKRYANRIGIDDYDIITAVREYDTARGVNVIVILTNRELTTEQLDNLNALNASMFFAVITVVNINEVITGGLTMKLEVRTKVVEGAVRELERRDEQLLCAMQRMDDKRKELAIRVDELQMQLEAVYETS